MPAASYATTLHGSGCAPISISSFRESAVDAHSYNQTPLILMDGIDLMPILEGHIELIEVLDRKRRNAAETGKPMYRA